MQEALSLSRRISDFCFSHIEFNSERAMVSQYARDQPAGFVNNLQTVAIVGVHISKTISHLLPLLNFEFAEME